MISLRGVGARRGRFEIADVSFDLAEGAYGVVIGPAGAGKSSATPLFAYYTEGRVRKAGAYCLSAGQERAVRGCRAVRTRRDRREGIRGRAPAA